MINQSGIEPINFVPCDKVLAYTTNRDGGVSEGEFASLNVGDHVGDSPNAVATNRDRLPFAPRIHWLKQTHSDRVVELPSEQYTADAAYTRRNDCACAVMTADCVPVLLADASGNTVAAIHAGLQGLKNGIIHNTVERAFSNVNRSQIFAWIGPHISVAHYELPDAEGRPFAAVPAAVTPSKNDGKIMLDLGKIAGFQLRRDNIHEIQIDGRCTYAEAQKLFSYRRSSHRGEPNCGRMVSVIMKTPAV